jgi:hypothetical protein
MHSAWKLVIAASILFAPAAYAEEKSAILFLNFNDAKNEIKQVRAAAAARGEDLVVIPEEGSDPKKDAYLNTKLLTRELKKLQSSGVSVSSIILSGHSAGPQGFFGTHGEMTREELDEALHAAPKIQKSVRAVHLFGCYAAAKSGVKLWGALFPKAKLVSGFHGSAPGSRSGEGYYSFIQDLLKKEGEFLKKLETDELNQKFRELKFALKMNTALCSGGRYYVDSKGVVDLKKHSVNCPEAELQKLKEGRLSVFLKYHLCSETPDVPKSTQSSDLRTYYSTGRKFEHCVDEFRDWQIPSPDRVLRLIFFRNILTNFQQFYSDDLGQIPDSIRSLQKAFPSLGQFEMPDDLTQLNRKKVRDVSDQLQLFLIDSVEKVRKMKSGSKKKALMKDIQKLGKMRYLMQNFLVGTSPRCVPLNWIEPESARGELSKPPQAAGCDSGEVV